MLRIGNNKIIKIYQDTEIKKLYLGNTIKYWNLRDKGSMPYYPIYDWEEYQYHKQSWWVDLNDQWELATVRQDADTNYETYQSFSNKGVNNGWARMKVNIDSGVDSFTIHYGSYAESVYDYTLIGHLDMDMSTSTSTSTGTTPSTSTWVKTSSANQSASAPNLSYTYTISDTSTQHFVWIAYRKDSSANQNDDRGYVSFDKTLNRNIDGWKKTIYTYTVQDNGDYDYTFYLATQDVISEDKETIIERTPITSTTEELRTQFIDGAEDDTFIVNRQIWTKRYYQVWINEWITTDYYTYGEWKGEMQFVEPEEWHFLVIYKSETPNQQIKIAESNCDVYDIYGNLLTNGMYYTFEEVGLHPLFLKQTSGTAGYQLFHSGQNKVVGVYIGNQVSLDHNNNSLRQMFDGSGQEEYGKYLYIGENITYIGSAAFAHFGRKVKELVIPPQVTAIYDWGCSIWDGINSSYNPSEYGCDRIYVWGDGSVDITSVYNTKTQFGYTQRQLTTNNPSTVKELYVPYGTSETWRNNVLYTSPYIINSQWAIVEMPEGATYENTCKRTPAEWYVEVMQKEQQ